jgi:hypothetical protein
LILTDKKKRTRHKNISKDTVGSGPFKKLMYSKVSPMGGLKCCLQECESYFLRAFLILCMNFILLDIVMVVDEKLRENYSLPS